MSDELKQEEIRRLAFILKDRTQQEYFENKFMKLMFRYTNNDGVVVTETFYLAKEAGYKLLTPPGIPFPTFNTKEEYENGTYPIESVLHRSLDVFKSIVAKDLTIFHNGKSTPFEVIDIQRERQEKFAKGAITISTEKGILTFFVRRANLNIYYMAITRIQFEGPCQEGSTKLK